MSFDRQFFVTTGAQGGRKRGPSKRRGDAAHYRKLSALAARARAGKAPRKART